MLKLFQQQPSGPVHFQGNSEKAAPSIHLINDIAHQNPDGTYNVVVEIPAGTTDKYETTKDTGEVFHPLKDGKPRQVNYLGYPANYGFVPQTLSDKAEGGDGDPVDVFLLSPVAGRGSVHKARVIGAIRLLDEGERDDKLLMVPAEGPFKDVKSLAGLKRLFPGVMQILKTWLGNYDGPGTTRIDAIVGKNKAKKIIEEGFASWQKRQ